MISTAEPIGSLPIPDVNKRVRVKKGEKGRIRNIYIQCRNAWNKNKVALTMA